MMMNQDNIYAALARAQATYKVAQKNGYNPHFKSYFSTYEDLIDASRESLTREGLSVSQFPDNCPEKDMDYYVSQLQYKSGEIIKSVARIRLKDPTDIQKFGSACSYLKRYAYASLCGIATGDDDDDGNSISSTQSRNEPIKRSSNLLTEKQAGFIKSLLKGDKELEKMICGRYKIESIAHLAIDNVNEVIKMLTPNNQE